MDQTTVTISGKVQDAVTSFRPQFGPELWNCLRKKRQKRARQHLVKIKTETEWPEEEWTPRR